MYRDISGYHKIGDNTKLFYLAPHKESLRAKVKAGDTNDRNLN